MESQVLENFYNKVYEGKYDQPITPLEYKKIPTTRTETVFKYMIDNFKGEKIMEIGTGSGRLAFSLLKSNLPIKYYVGIELSKPYFEKLKQNIQDPRFTPIHGNIENIDLNFGKFDAIIMIAVIEHLIDPMKTMKKLRSILNPGGFVYINTPNIADIGARRKLLMGRFPSTASKNEGLTRYDGGPVSMYDQGHLHYFTFSSLTKMLKQYCGYNSFEIVPQPVGKPILGRGFQFWLAKTFPTLFSEVNIVAR